MLYICRIMLRREVGSARFPNNWWVLSIFSKGGLQCSLLLRQCTDCRFSGLRQIKAKGVVLVSKSLAYPSAPRRAEPNNLTILHPNKKRRKRRQWLHFLAPHWLSPSHTRVYYDSLKLSPLRKCRHSLNRMDRTIKTKHEPLQKWRDSIEITFLSQLFYSYL